MDSQAWKRGQRWVSDSEPELGLGIIRSSGDGRVDISFPAAGEARCYATETAPLRRVSFSPGDRIRTRDGREVTVEKRLPDDGLWVYQTNDGDVPEGELCDSISFSKPEDRLFGGKLDEPSDFELRGEALRRRADMRRSPVRGLAGARMDLIPHQLFIADEVANRPRPRVLLADEVGLGKTIEACLILHRLLLTGRAERVLILVPEPLVHQWFVELLRRFQLSFSLFDEERCQAIEHGDPEGNPFLDSQWVLASVDFLAENETRAEQVITAGWDALVVDEAHHLEWTPDHAGASYELVRKLAEKTRCLLLLTATPEQLGPEGHFARLRLLDPDRYPDPAVYQEETRHYEEIADAVEALADGGGVDEKLHTLIASRPRLERAADALGHGDETARAVLIDGLLDSFGVGRVMFRNTRAKLGGFPGRDRHLVALPDEENALVKWLAGFLEANAEDKVLVITRSRENAEELVENLRAASGANTALFHEELSLLQRDRNAAYFAEADGARVLVCSEIGSEGRNFQFARHLVLADLPDDVDLLEQRIGRLDRIGRKGTIEVHVPYTPGTAEETYLRWLDEGLDAFRTSPKGAAEIKRTLADELSSAFEQPSRIDALISTTRTLRSEIEERLARGQERLLARASHRPDEARRLVEKIRAWDEDRDFEDFVLRLFEHSGLHIEDLGDRRYFLLPGNLKSDAFPALPHDGMSVTLDRARALAHEQEAFLTWDHPMVRGALDLMLGTEAGNASFAVWESAGEKRIILEAHVLVECVAPAHLHAERFLPQTPLRIAVDHTGKDLTGDPSLRAARLRPDNPAALLRNAAVKQKLLPAMLEHVRRAGEELGKPVIAEALTALNRVMDSEISRLRELAELNDHVKPEEIETLEEHRAAIAAAIRQARVRLDSVRLVWNAPAT